MAIWSSFEGTIKCHKSKKISIKSVLLESYDELTIHVDTTEKNDEYIHTISCVYSLDGKEAWDFFYNFINKIKELDKNAHIDISCNIRLMK